MSCSTEPFGTDAAPDAVSLRFASQPGDGLLGTTIRPIRVEVVDALGNVFADATSPVTVSITNGTGTTGAVLSGTTVQTPVDGVVMFDDLTIDRAGSSFTLGAASDGLAGATTDAFDIVAAGRLQFVTHPTNTQLGEILAPIVVRAEDASGNLDQSFTEAITLSIASGTGASGATLGGTVTRNATGGAATFDDLVIGRAGNGYRLDASASGLAEHTSDPFSIVLSGFSNPTFQIFASGLTSPVGVVVAPNDSTRLYVMEQAGRVRVVHNGQLLSTPYLDITSLVGRNASEQGFLGLAFHPNFTSNREFFVYYTNQTGIGNSEIVRYVASNDPDVANPVSSQTLLTITQPFDNHNAGQLVFGLDGMLYIAVGDGGSGGDPQGHAQNRATLLGNILRIDVDNGSPYAIPSDNPYAGHATFAEEIWTSGLRNPWRFSFDRLTVDLYFGDVGQGSWEEVDFAPAGAAGGLNFGWNIKEGNQCFTGDCSTPGLTDPIFEYSHAGGACSITGGYVYRGAAFPQLHGHYFYADFCAGWIRSFRYSGGSVTDQNDWNAPTTGTEFVTSFGEDVNGELYFVTGSGYLYKMQ